MSKLRYVARIIRLTISNFLGNNCLRHSAALSFYTLFSLAPMVMVSVQVASLFAAEVDFERELVAQFGNLVGERGAEGVTVLIDTLEETDASRFQLLIGAVLLMFSATSIFVQLQEAFNEIFSVIASGRGFIKKALDRLISLGIILSLGLVMILSLVIDSSVVLLHKWLSGAFPELAVIFINALQYTVLGLLATLEIYALLNFLPDVHIPREYKVRGCALITLLLVFGKSTIGWYIGSSSLGEIGGASASVIVLMLWIYYSSMIVFLGAEFIKSMAIVDNVVLQPKRYAVRVQSVIVEKDPKTPETAAADDPVIAPSIETGKTPEACAAAVVAAAHPAVRAELAASSAAATDGAALGSSLAPSDHVVGPPPEPGEARANATDATDEARERDAEFPGAPHPAR
ncbi:MAG: hypothetical protein RLZZ227_165 [Pseudomonadota bacterium]|jgi:membrane protein